MEDEKKLEDFDPSKTDAFQENLSRAFEPEIIEAEPIDITTEDSSSILTITEEGAVDGSERKEKEKKEEKVNPENRKEEEVQAELAEIEGMLAVEIEKEEKEEEELPVIHTDFDFEDEIPQAEEVDDAVLESISNQLASQVSDGYSEAEKESRGRKVPIWMISVGVAVASLILFFVFFFGTGAGRKILLGTKLGKYLISHV